MPEAAERQLRSGQVLLDDAMYMMSLCGTLVLA